jgi:hypothetical protein
MYSDYYSIFGAEHAVPLRVGDGHNIQSNSLRRTQFNKGESMGTILLIILILLLIGALPAWPYSSGWGYWPSGGLGLILLILIILALTGRL